MCITQKLYIYIYIYIYALFCIVHMCVLLVGSGSNSVALESEPSKVLQNGTHAYFG